MTYIVSANYLNRDSEKHPWLIRLDGAPIKESVEVRAVHATGVTFRDSVEEVGFGCSVVAQCETANEISETPTGVTLQKVYFDDLQGVFHKVTNGKIVYSCKALVLEPNGDMFVVMNDEPEKTADLPGAIETAFSGEQ